MGPSFPAIGSLSFLENQRRYIFIEIASSRLSESLARSTSCCRWMIERDQVFVPKTRSQRGLKPECETPTSKTDDQTTLEALDDLFEDAPLYIPLRLIVQLTIG